MSEEDRRELIARQHRALYGDNSTLYNADGTAARPSSQDARVPAGARGASPMTFDNNGEGAVQMPPRDRANSTASPAGNAAAQQSFALLNDQQSRRTSNSSPSGSPPLSQGPKGTLSGVAPIGTRPIQTSGGLNKRSTTPLTPSSLAYGFSSAESQNNNAAPQQMKDERSGSAASNPALADKNVGLGGGWGGNSGVWGKNALGSAQASVWG
jgi:hypothetical protein